MVDKLMHYFEIYERHFDAFRGGAPTVVELGVSQGGSLDMWRWYFGRRSTIVGVDVDPRVADLPTPSGVHVHVGDQADPQFLASLVDRHGPPDIVIDDGSHRHGDRMASLTTLWEMMEPGAVYLVEDVCTSYLDAYGGGVGRSDTFIGETKALVDEVHGYWIGDGADPDQGAVDTDAHWTRTLGGIHVYDSIVVLDRAARQPPVRRQTGRPAFDDVYGVPVDQWLRDDHRTQLERLNAPMARARRTLRDPVGAFGRLRYRLRD